MFVKFWQSPKVRQWPDHQKLLGAYLLTCPHRTSEGLFWLPHGYVAQDLGWSIERVSEGYLGLIGAGFCAYHDPTETVFLLKALKYEAPAGDKQIQGAINRLADVPLSPLFSLLREAAAQHAPDFAKALESAFPTPPTDTPSEGYQYPSDSSSSSSSSSSNSFSSSSSSSDPSSLLPSLTTVGDIPVDNPTNQSRKGKGRNPSRPPRNPRHPSDAFVVDRARQIQAEDGPQAAHAYLRKVAENYGQMDRAEQLRRLETMMAQDAAAEAGQP
jgi:hypothetical protein